MIINEVLSFLSFYLDKCTCEHIKKTALSFYTAEEVCNAKKVLWNSFSNSIPSSFLERKSSDKRPAIEANTDDILKALRDLDAADVSVEFVSRDLNRIPSFDPEELNLTFMLERVRNLEKKVKDHEEMLTSQRIDIMCNQDKLDQIDNNKKNDLVDDIGTEDFNINQVSPLVLEEVENGIVSQPSSDIENGIPFVLKEINVRKERNRCFSENDVSKVANDIFITDQLQKDSDNLVRPESRIENSPVVNHNRFRGVTNGSSSAFYSRTFTASRDQPRFSRSDHNNSRHKKGNHNSNYNSGRLQGAQYKSGRQQGTQFNSGRLQGAPYRGDRLQGGDRLRGGDRLQGARQHMRDIFLYRVESGSEKDIVDFCKSKEIFIGTCSRVSHPAAKYKSFRLNVIVGQANIILDEGFWPKGIRVKEFVEKPNQEL